MKPDNISIYDKHWGAWHDMKIYGPSNRWLRTLVRHIVQGVEASAINTILDVGCGEGTNTANLSMLFSDASILGIDFSESGIRAANTHYASPKLQFQHDMESTALHNAHYDLISCFDVLEHIENWKPFFQSLTAAATQYILLSVPTGRMRNYEVNVGHFRNFKKNEIEDYAAKLGFKVQEAYYAGFPFYSPIFREIYNITNSGTCSYTQGAFGTSQKMVSSIIYFLFNFCSTRHNFGDYCILLLKKA